MKTKTPEKDKWYQYKMHYITVLCITLNRVQEDNYTHTQCLELQYGFSKVLGGLKSRTTLVCRGWVVLWVFALHYVVT